MLKNIKYINCQENLFTFNGRSGHEILFIYECDFVESKFYQIEEITFMEKQRKKRALWVECDRFKSGELRLVPEQFLEYL